MLLALTVSRCFGPSDIADTDATPVCDDRHGVWVALLAPPGAATPRCAPATFIAIDTTALGVVHRLRSGRPAGVPDARRGRDVDALRTSLVLLQVLDSTGAIISSA